MKPELRFHSYVTVGTIVVMYFVIANVVPSLPPAGGIAEYVVPPLGALLMSLGVYTFAAKTLQTMSRRLKLVKRHLLGPSYLNGTWVGSFEEQGTVYDTVEHLEQTLSSLKIRGQAPNTAGASYAYWHSSSETILEREGRLNYTYELHRNDQIFSSEGICLFYFERADEASAPMLMHGYSVDLLEQQPPRARMENNERRISENLIPFEVAFVEARATRQSAPAVTAARP
jgi:hypothetical protein